VDGSDRGGDEVSDSEEGKSHELVIIRRRTSEDEGKHHGGVWKIAYADFMTAMMAFFLVMWLINSTDKKTLTQVATYFNPLRLTDKRPTPKGLEEPDGNEGKDSGAQKDAKKKDGEAKGKKKTDDAHAGEVRSRGRLFQRELEEQEQKAPTQAGATPGENPRQAGGRAYRDPFDPVLRTEIMPSKPSNEKASSARPPAAAPPAVESDRGTAPSTKPDITPQQPSKEVADRADTAQREAALKKATADAAQQDISPQQPPKEIGERADAAQLEASIKGATAEAEKPDITPRQPSKEAGERGDAAQPEAAIKKATADAVKPDITPQQPSKEVGERADAAQLEAAIKKAIADSVLGSVPNVDVVATPEGVLISLTDDYEFGMFAIASAEPRPAMVVVMDKVAKILLTRSEQLVVRGHTDRRPYRTATYDNWRLSAARAHMAYLMLARSGIDEKRFERIEGHADRSLRVAHDPEAAQNRRIEILLRKHTP
jgi:chemotaxis protein MotB